MKGFEATRRDLKVLPKGRWGWDWMYLIAPGIALCLRYGYVNEEGSERSGPEFYTRGSGGLSIEDAWDNIFEAMIVQIVVFMSIETREDTPMEWLGAYKVFQGAPIEGWNPPLDMLIMTQQDVIADILINWDGSTRQWAPIKVWRNPVPSSLPRRPK